MLEVETSELAKEAKMIDEQLELLEGAQTTLISFFEQSEE